MNPELKELAYLLSTRSLDHDAQELFIKDFEREQEDLQLPPELSDSCEKFFSLELGFLLAMPTGNCASGDKYDEVHTILQREMLGEDFPDIPTSGVHLFSDYHKWLNERLKEWNDDHGGYEAVSLDDRSTENLHLFIVYRDDCARLMDLSEKLGLQFHRQRD